MVTLESSPHWSTVLTQLLDGQSLDKTQAQQLMQGWLANTIPPALSGALLAAIQAKGVAAAELVGMATVLQSQSQGKPTQEQGCLVDTCGTGGDGSSTFNISTAVAFVTAAAGVKVAKHGNRSASSKVGSADVLEALGINLQAPPAQVAAAVDTVGITFLFAPGWHPALKSVAPVRKTLKIRTVFNLLGPLVNPLHPTGQVIGVYSPTFLTVMAEALQQLGINKAWIVHGRETLDEAGLGAETDIVGFQQDTLDTQVLNPRQLELTPAAIAELKGGEVAENMAILTAVLQGKGTAAQRDVVALNAAPCSPSGGNCSVGRSYPGGNIGKRHFATGCSLGQITGISSVFTAIES